MLKPFLYLFCVLVVNAAVIVNGMYGEFDYELDDDFCEHRCVEERRLQPPFGYVCGTDGNTYRKKSIVDCYNFCFQLGVGVKYFGVCVEPLPKDCECPESKANPFAEHVCGSNGKAYDNKFALDCHNRCTNSSIKMVDVGPCVGRSDYVTINGKTLYMPRPLRV